MKHLIDCAVLVVLIVNLPFAVYIYFLFGNTVEGFSFKNLTGLFPDILRCVYVISYIIYIIYPSI